MSKGEGTTRRSFLRTSASAATGIALGVQAMGAPAVQTSRRVNERIRMGFIGVGNRGTQLLNIFMKNEDVDVVALSDVYEPYLLRDRSKVHPKFLEMGGRIPDMGETFPGKVDTYTDFRRILDRQDIDAVCIATPDHWHAIQTIMAVESGKDVYVEKPLSITIHEGRKMIEAADRTNRVVQVGLNRRGSPIYQELAKQIPNGKIGKVSFSRAYRVSNMYPNGIGQEKPADPPPGLDWDMWLGPRAFRPFQYNITPYKFRWWSDYSSQVGNWGVHYLDLIRWLIQEQAPVSVSAHGGKYVLNDDRTIPDTMEVTFEFPSGGIAVFGVYEATGGRIIANGGDIELFGTKGNLVASERGYTISPNGVGQFQEREALLEAEKVEENYGDSTVYLIRNFLDCVKNRETPWCPLEEGHRSTTFALLANIALTTGERITWDPANERITNSKRANEMLHYEYRSPWRLS